MNCEASSCPDAARAEADSRSAADVSYPTLSIAICTRHRPGPLVACVRSVARQTRRPTELIVVDDGKLSAGDLRTLASICESAGIPFVYLHKGEPGLPKSRNLAVRHARGEIVQFLDDDVTVAPEFCREILRLFAADADGALVGTEGTLIEPAGRRAGDRVFDWVYRVAGWWALRPRPCRRPPLPPVLRDRRRATPTWNIVGATMAFRRSALLEHPFDERLSGYALGEDRELAYRLGRRGWIVRSPAARAVHHRESAGRPDPFAFGQMVVRNYVRIMTRTGLTAIGDRLVIGYSLAVLAFSLLLFVPVNPRRYLWEFAGMVWGVWQVVRAAVGGRIPRDTCRSETGSPAH